MAITRNDVARRAGTSGTTVSLVMSDRWEEYRIAPETRERVLSAATELGYTPNRAAQELRNRRTGRLSLLLHPLARHYQTSVLNALHKAAAAQGYSLLVFFADGASELPQMVENAWSQSDGLLFWATDPGPEVARKLSKEGAPVVRIELMARRQSLRADLVTLDHARAMETAIAHLLENGYGDLHFTSNSQTRLRAIRSSLKRHGLAAREGTFVFPGGADFEHGREVAERVAVRDDGRTGIVADSDAVAVGCMSELQRQGLLAGRDYGIVGFNDLPVSSYLPVPLSSMRLPSESMAERAIGLVIQRMQTPLPAAATPQRVALQCRLVARQSSSRRELPVPAPAQAPTCAERRTTEERTPV